MADPGSRFQHLLQPIRDLSKVWNIEIAEELEKYMQEVSTLSFSAAGGKSLNFAEAALLIQGSTAVYSRKVEQLHALVYQALGQLTAEKEKQKENEKGPDGQVRKKILTGLSAPIPETEALLTIDHLIKEGRNIILDDATLQRQAQKQALHRRVPLFLMPRDRSDGKQEFRIGTCTVHSSGAYLIQESDAQLLEDQLSHSREDDSDPHSPLAPPPPSCAPHERLQELLSSLPGRPEPEHSLESPEPPGTDGPFVEQHEPFGDQLPDDGGDACDVGDPLSELLPPPHQAEPEANVDFFALLDEDAQEGQDTPFEVGRCYKRFGTKALLSKGPSLPEAGAWEPLTDAEFWRSGHAGKGLSALLTAGNPVETLFRVVGTHLRNGGRTETERSGFSAAWLEFEDHFNAAKRKRASDERKRLKELSKAAKHGDSAAAGPAPETPMQAFNFGADSDDEQFGTPPRAWQSEAPEITPMKNGFFPMNEDSSSMFDEQRQRVAKLEGIIEDAQSQYESSIRNQLHKMQGGVDALGGRKYPELYENVRRWQEQLAPVLKEFESHPEFDINSYGSKMLGKMVAVGTEKSDDAEDLQSGQEIPFSRLVYGQPRWEVCRRFLTCLILTNQGNTEIVCDAEDHGTDKFGVKLLKADVPKRLSLYGDEEEPHMVPSSPSAVPIEAGQRRKSVAMSPRPVASPARRSSSDRLGTSPAHAIAMVGGGAMPARRGTKRRIEDDSFDVD